MEDPCAKLLAFCNIGQKQGLWGTIMAVQAPFPDRLAEPGSDDQEGQSCPAEHGENDKRQEPPPFTRTR